MKKILALLAVLALVAGYAVAQSGLPNAASTNAGWHTINPATTNNVIVNTYTYSTNTIVYVSAVSTNSVATMATNTIISITGVKSVLRLDPLTGPSFVNQ